MSDVFEAILLGIIQGISEFLPISSSGHLEIGKKFLGFQATQEDSLFFTVVLHAATACSTMLVFRKEISAILQGLFRPNGKDARAFSLKILLSMIPAVLVGFFLEDLIDGMFSGQLVLVAVALIITAALLFFADFAQSLDKKIGFLDAIIIGLAQAIAIIPGISRSGATISTAILLKNDRKAAAEFSFLMVIPLIFGKMAKDLLSNDVLADINWLPLFAGFISAFFTGIFACIWMIRLVKNAKLRYFAFYCLIVAVIVFILEWR